MKVIKRNIVVVALMFITLLSYSNNDNSTTRVDNKKLKVVFYNVKKGHLLTVKNDKDVIFYSEEISIDGKLSKFIDFSNLADGNYVIELEKDFQIIIRPFQIKAKKLFFDIKAEKTIFKPVLRNDKNIVFISKLNFEDHPLHVKVLYYDDVIYSETLADKSRITRVYLLDENQKGAYTVITSSNGRNYSKEFKI